jgi:two-component system, OmpR family, response regulator
MNNFTQPPRPLTILVVEDFPDGAKSLAMILRHHGHIVHVAMGAKQALENTAAHPPDVVLMDIGLPGMDGYEVARRIGELLPRKPVFCAVTGYGMESDRERSWQEGFARHFLKPVDLTELVGFLGQVSQSLEQGSAADAIGPS